MDTDGPSQNDLEPEPPPEKATVPQAWRAREPPRLNALIVDHQNLVGRAMDLGLHGIDPNWLAEIALRIGNCAGMTLVTDLAMTNPMTGISYMADAVDWADQGFSIVHVPARKIRITKETEIAEGPSSSPNRNRIKRKDQTDGGIRQELQRWCMVPEITHVILFTHDVDFARDLFAVTKAYGKRTVLLNAGNGMAPSLLNSADERVNVLSYLAGYSVTALDRQHFWHPKQDLESLGEKLWRCITDHEGRRNSWLLRQFKDAQNLLRYLILECQCIRQGLLPDSKRLSWRLMQNALHECLFEEKAAAGLDRAAEIQPCLISSQQLACMDSLRSIMDIWVANEVLLSDTVNLPNCGVHRQFYVNLDHPAVVVLTETDFS